VIWRDVETWQAKLEQMDAVKNVGHMRGSGSHHHHGTGWETDRHT